MRRLRIILVDDHETVRTELKEILSAQRDMEVVAEASDGYAAIVETSRLRPDVVVIDVSMPRLNGLKATEAIKLCCPSTAVLAVTRHGDEAYFQQLLQAGASGYVSKKSHLTELPHAIRAVASGGSYLDPEIVGKVIGTLNRRARRANGSEPLMSHREEEVLRMVVWGHSNKDVAKQLGLSVKTIETHKAKAMQKLGLGSRLDLMRFAVMRGWLMQES